MTDRRSRRAVAVAVTLGVALLTAALWITSRGKWSDPLIDSGREWIVPDALSRGALLYRDVVYWFGPFTPYFQSLFFRAWGSGFGSLVLAGAVAAAATLAVLFFALRRVTGRREAALWTALAIPALIFMPNAGGALLGMGYRIWHAAAFALGAVAMASAGPPSRRNPWWPLASGACAALAALCRTEWGLAAIVAVQLAAVVRPRERRRGFRNAALATLGFAVVFGGGLGAFLLAAGPAAVIAEGHVLLTGLPPETLRIAAAGVNDWRGGIAELLYSAAMWCSVFLLATLLSRREPAAQRRSLGALALVLALLALAALCGGAGGAVLFSVAPLVGLGALAAGMARRRGSVAAALAASGFLCVVLSHRRLFHIGDAPYVAPPLLFAFVCAAGLLRLAAVRERTGRTRVGAMQRSIVAGLVVAAFAGRIAQYASVDDVPIPGTSGMLSARPELAREIDEVSAAIRNNTREGDGLVVFPEGELLNLLSGRANSIRHKLALPGYLTEANEPDVIAELERARPASIVLWRRPVTEYDHFLFGRDYGLRVLAWIERNYRLVPFQPSGTPARVNPRFLLAFRQTSR